MRFFPIILLIMFLFSAGAFANPPQKIETDPFGNVTRFWVEGNKFFSSNTSSPKPKQLYSFAPYPDSSKTESTKEVISFDLQMKKIIFYLVFTDKNKLYFTGSKDEGNTFSMPLALAEKAKSPCLSSLDDQIAVAWEKEKNIYIARSYDYGQSFSKPLKIQITGEALSSPALLTDPFGNVHLCFLAKDEDLDLNRIIYTQIDQLDFKTLYSSYDQIINLHLKNLPSGFLAFWQKEYSGRRESFLSVSINQGGDFCSAKPFDFENDLKDLDFVLGKLCAIDYDKDAVIKTVERPSLSPPLILTPTNNDSVNSSNLKIKYNPFSSDPLILKIDLSEQDNFLSAKTWSFEQLIVSLTQEAVEYKLPVELANGSYTLRISASNGLVLSPFSQTVKINIDNIAPEITTLEVERKGRDIYLRGETSEFPAWLSINGSSASLEALPMFSSKPQGKAKFENHFPMLAGKNIFTLAASDCAGNLSLTTKEVFYNPASPEITVLNPQINQWFKSDSTIFIEALVFDLQGDIEDGASAKVSLDSNPLKETLSYDREDGNLSGFLSLPANLTDGKHKAEIVLADRQGNEGKTALIINIDNSPPQVEKSSFFSNSQTKISVPAVDYGAGLDPSGTLIKFSGLSFEGSASLEGEKIILTSKHPISEGTYEAEIILRDKVGNLGEKTCLSLVIDHTPPLINLTGTYESQTSQNKILIQATAEEYYPSHINVYLNQSKTASFDWSGNSFSKEINLLPGNNRIQVEAVDQSGNSAFDEINIFADIQAAPSLLTAAANGPNPFSPNSESMYFSYTLLKAADLKIYIFDLAGTLIWTKQISNTSSGTTAWNGMDQFGAVVDNGVYPYLVYASSSDLKEIQRGKIIVLK